MIIEKYIDFTPLTIAPDALLKNIVTLIAQRQVDKKVSCLLVVKADKLVGIITQSDLVRLVAIETNLVTTTIDMVMTQPVKTMLRSQCQTIDSVLSFLRQNSIKNLPILDDNQKLIGVTDYYQLTLHRNSLEAESLSVKNIKNFSQDISSKNLILPNTSNKSFSRKDLFDVFEQHFKTITNKVPIGIFQTDTQGNCLCVNSRWQEITGLSALEARGTGWVNALHPDDYQKVVEEWNKCAQMGKEFSMTYRFKKPNNQVVWVSGNAAAYYINDQAVGFLGSVMDISIQQIAFKKRQQAELQLQQERDFSQAVIDTVGALVAVLDREGAIVSFNRTCEQLTGYCFAEVKGKRVWDFLILSEEKTAVKALFKLLLSGQLSNQHENYWLSKDGNKNLIAWSNTVILDSAGKIEFIIATGIDITEQRRVWNKLEFQYRQTKLLTEITDKIRLSIDLNEILQTTVTEVQHLLACDRVLILELKPNNTAVPISESILSDFDSMLGYELADPLLMGEYIVRYRQGKVLAINDLTSAAIGEDIKLLLKQFQIKAKLVVPILSQKELKGVLVAHQCHNPRQWHDHEIQLLNQLADSLGVALSQAQLFNYTEQLVSERTKELTCTNELLKAEISERKQTEQDLRENQDKLAGILDNADEAIISINEQQQIQLFNQGAEKIFGYQASEIIGKSLDILLPQIFRQVHRQHIKQFASSTEQSRRMAERSSEVFGRRKNGAEFAAEASVAKLQTGSGMLFTVMLKDISERQYTQEKLRMSKALLAKAEKIAKIGSWEYDHETNRRSWSEELFNILDFDPSLPIPTCQEILDLIHPEDLLLVQDTLRKGHNKGKSWEINYRLLLSDGRIKYVESRGESTVNLEGKVTRVLETLMDVSDRIQAERSLQRTKEQLELITDALPILIAYIDNQQRYRYNNRTYETWYGKPSYSLRGKLVKDILGDENYQKVKPYIESALAGRTVTFESQPTAQNGSSYWISVTYIPDYDASGKIKGFFSMIDDITERKAIDRMKSEFISIASHEMRTPLTSVHGVLELLCAERLGELSDQGKVMAHLALRNSDRIVNLVNDILNLERIESGRDEITKIPCDSASLIQQAIDTVSSIAREQKIILSTNFVSITLSGDRDRLIQTLTNLLSNAIKFSPANSEVTISAQLHGNKIQFSVRDRGRGIPQEKLVTIFERFEQVDASDSRKKGGTGLGLAICRHVVKQHGGKIWVDSTYGKGSTFFFSIPLS